jgi:hypothetical protein
LEKLRVLKKGLLWSTKTTKTAEPLKSAVLNTTYSSAATTPSTSNSSVLVKTDSPSYPMKYKSKRNLPTSTVSRVKKKLSLSLWNAELAAILTQKCRLLSSLKALTVCS